MSEKTFLRVASAIFLLVAAVLLSRLAFKWEVVLAGWLVPVWLSAVAFAITAYLAYEGFRLGGKS